MKTEVREHYYSPASAAGSLLIPLVVIILSAFLIHEHGWFVGFVFMILGFVGYVVYKMLNSTIGVYEP